jgi:hypothetical protein
MDSGPGRAARVIVTAGPTLPAAMVRAILPYATVSGPVAADEVLHWGLSRGDVLVIIDGLFLQSRAVRHKELLALLDRGVIVVGAASMGALRAAELADFGMVGVGQVFRAFRSGRIVGDDEVALLHSDAENDYRPLGWALVDLRSAVSDAHGSGVLSGPDGHAIIAAAAALPFTLRTTFAILGGARARGGTAEGLAAFRDYIRARDGFQKRADALRALRVAARLATCTTAAGPVSGSLRYRGQPARLAVTTYLRAWSATDPCHRRVSDYETAMAAATSVPQYPELFRRIAAECLLQSLAGVPAATSVAQARQALRQEYGLEPQPDGLLGWDELRRVVSGSLRALNLPLSIERCPPEARLVLRHAERAEPWSVAGPLLATRVWRSDPQVDWLTPLMRRLDLIGLGEAARGWAARMRRADSAPPQEVRRRCANALREWGADDAAAIRVVLAERGFVDVAEFVRVARRGFLAPAYRSGAMTGSTAWNLLEAAR